MTHNRFRTVLFRRLGASYPTGYHCACPRLTSGYAPKGSDLAMAGIIQPSTLERIREASDIVDVIGSYLPLKRAGANFVTLCPFHHEKTPSFNVSPGRQMFRCFGCQKGGDVFTFVREYENLTFVEAVRRLAERAKIPLEFDQTPGQQQARFLKETLFEMHEGICQRWHAALLQDTTSAHARAYLEQRQVSAEAVQQFRLGYAPEAWDDTVNWARAKRYDLATVERGGLIIRRDDGSGYYDRFRGRLIFPICDEQGRVIGFSGRVLEATAKAAKYVNSPETQLFTKGRVLYGLDKSRRALLDAEFAVICEGQLDLISCYLAGIRNVVAPQGTALTAEHCRILRRYVEEVVLCFDSDPAGQNAALRALDDLLGSGLAIRVAVVPAPHDPDSFLKAEGGEAFQRLIAAAPAFFDFLLVHLCQRHEASTDRGRVAILRGMAERVLKTGNAVLIDTYAQRTAQRLAVGVDAVRAEFRKSQRAAERPSWHTGSEGAESGPPSSALEGAMRDANGSTHSEATRRQRPAVTEFQLLRLLLLDELLVPWALEFLDAGLIQHPTVRRLVEQRLVAARDGTWRGVAPLVSMLDEEARDLVTEAATWDQEIPEPARQIQDIVKRLRDQQFDQRVAEIGRQLLAPEVSDEAKLALLRERDGLRRAKEEPLVPTKAP